MQPHQVSSPMPTTSHHGGEARPQGALGLEVIRADGAHEPVIGEGLASLGDARVLTAVPARWLSLAEVARHGAPRRGLPDEVNEWRDRNWPMLLRQYAKIAIVRKMARLGGMMTAHGRLSLAVIRADGRVLDLGLASFRVVTTLGVKFIVDAFQNLVEPELMKFHALGTGAVAEAVGDAALGTELTTQYNPDGTRATGSTTVGAGANIYRTVGTNTVDAAAAVTEHGILSQALVGGVLIDRSVFAVVNLATGDGLQSTYDLTFASGG